MLVILCDDTGRAEADKHDVPPLCGLGLLDYISYEFHPPVPKIGVYTFFPDTAEIPERSALNFHGASYKILAEVQIADASAQGVILAQGSRFVGHALFIKDRKPHDVYNFIGLKPEQHLESEPLEPGTYVLGVEFIKESQGERRESHGTAELLIGEDVVAEGALRTKAGHFADDAYIDLEQHLAAALARD